LWTTSHLDCILALGDKLYETIAKEENKYLLIDDIPNNVAVFTEHFHGLLNGETNIPFYALYDALENLFSKHESCIYTMGNSEPYYTSAIFMCEQRYFFFDPHSRSDVGMLKPDGKACITIHNSVRNLCDFIKHLAASLNLKGKICFEMAVFKESSSLETSSDSDFSGFDPVSDGEYCCKLFIAEEAIKHDSMNVLSDVSDISSISDDILKQVDNEVDEFINDLNNSSTFLEYIDSNVFDTSFMSATESPTRQCQTKCNNKGGSVSLIHDDDYEGDIDEDFGVDAVNAKIGDCDDDFKVGDHVDDFEVDVDDDFEVDDVDDVFEDDDVNDVSYIDTENCESDDSSDMSFESDDNIPLTSL
jgi:hypothetical protein